MDNLSDIGFFYQFTYRAKFGYQNCHPAKESRGKIY